MAVLEVSRPRRPRLARYVSSQAIFVGVLFLLTTLFTIEGVAQVPGAPTGFTVTPGDRKTTLSWTAPSDTGGSAIIRYEYRRSGTGALTAWTSTGSTNTTYTDTGLTNGGTYSYVVRAVNSDGNGAQSSSVGNITPRIPAPTNLTATPGDGQVTLNWTAPSVAAAITHYELQFKAAGESWTAWASTGSTSAPYTKPGLTNGTQYSFRVRAARNAEDGLESASVSATPMTAVAVPAAPTNLTATPGNGQVTLSWTAPSGPITRYECKYSSSGGVIDWHSTGSTSTTYIVTHLTNGQAYSFRVRAVNSGGNGTASASATATPTIAVTPPAAPTGLTATPGDGQVTLSWTAPSGSITRYEYNQNGGTTWTSTGSTSTTYTVTGLTNGTQYTFKVRAVNSGGNGTASASASATPMPSPPAAPTGLTATPGDGQVTLSWTAPSGTITRYEYNQNGGTTWTSTGSTSTTYTVTGLTNGTSYTFKVRAVGSGGSGTASASASATPMMAVVAPAAPTGLTATPGDRQVTLSWTAPSGPITGYQYRQNSGTWTSTNSTGTTYTVTGLTNGQTYSFEVRAVNSAGDGAASASASATPQLPPAPGAPTGLTTTPGNGQVRLSWTAPSGPITGYQYTQDDGTTWTSAGTSTTYLVTGLANGTPYTFKVRAVNSGGNGTASASATATPVPGAPPPPPPADPVDLKVEVVANGDQKTANAILTWNPPSDAEADGYEYRYRFNPWTPWISTGSSDTTHTVTGLQIGTTYDFQIRAFTLNAAGTPEYFYTSPAKSPSNADAIAPQRTKLRIYECPVGWTRGSVFGKTKKALIYELKVDIDRTNRVSIYQLKSLAIYVHPDEGLETLDGWTLQVGTLYNNFGQEFKLTTENSVIDEYDFAHIKNPEDKPIPLGTVGFIGQSLPGFDYRLYDAQGVRVDFGISCYKEGGLTWRLWNTEDPRVLRVLPFPISEAALDVRMKELDWNTPFFRTQWTAAIMPDLPDAPAAPSLVKKNIVGTWGDLKKQ